MVHKEGVCGDQGMRLLQLSEVEPLKKKMVIMVVISSNTHEMC